MRADITRGMDLIPQPYYWADEIFGDSPPLATRSGWLALACMPFVLYVHRAALPQLPLNPNIF